MLLLPIQILYIVSLLRKKLVCFKNDFLKVETNLMSHLQVYLLTYSWGSF